jgi:hypothetical protein
MGTPFNGMEYLSIVDEYRHFKEREGKTSQGSPQQSPVITRVYASEI